MNTSEKTFSSSAFTPIGCDFLMMKTIKITLIFAFINLRLAYGQNNLDGSYNEIDRKQEKTNLSIYNIQKKFRLTRDTFLRQSFQIEIDSLLTVTDKLKEQRLLIDFAFIKTYPSSKTSLELISKKIWSQQADKYCDTLLVLFNHLSAELKRSELGIQTQRNLNNFKNSQIGCQASNFHLTDINGREIDLKSLINNKYVLLDFWASWCTPCRQDIPYLKQFMDTSKVCIVAISRDDNIENWKQAIVEEKTSNWIQVSTKLNTNEVLDKYFVWAIPVKVLINKEGKIIGRWRGGGEENKNDLLKILKKEFTGASVPH